MQNLEKDNQLEQVFCYITGICNANCITCYLGEEYKKLGHIPKEVLFERMKKYREMGATKMTLLGGEATLHPELNEILLGIRELGYEYIRITTNGMYDKSLVNLEGFKYVNTIAYSLDGYTEELNSMVRPNTSLTKIVENMMIAHAMGIDTRINSTVTAQNIDHVEDMIALASKYKVSQINFNIVFMEGNAKDQTDICVSPEKWNETYQKIKNLDKKYNIEIKTPVGYQSENVSLEKEKVDEIDKKVNSRIYCLMDGREYYCLLFLGKDQYVRCKCDSKIPNCNQLIQENGELPYCLDYKYRIRK